MEIEYQDGTHTDKAVAVAVVLANVEIASGPWNCYRDTNVSTTNSRLVDGNISGPNSDQPPEFLRLDSYHGRF